MDLNNKVAIVTGGIGGIGLVTVQHLLKNGVEYVGIFDLTTPDDENVLQSLQQLGGEFNDNKFGYYSCDVTNDKEFKACYEKVVELKKYVDILINSAGTIAESNVDLNIDVNFKAGVKCTLFAIEYMRKDKGGKGGTVVNIASITGLGIYPHVPIYSAAKHGLVSFVRSMKRHNESLGVRVLCLCPGCTKTNLFNQNPSQNSSLSFIDNKKLASYTKTAYLQKPDTVAAAIVDIIKKGEGGAVWLVEMDKPPCGVKPIIESEELRFDL